MSERDLALEKASQYVSKVFCDIWKNLEPSFDSVQDDEFLLTLIGILEAIFVSAGIRLEQDFENENLEDQFREEHHRIADLIVNLSSYERKDMELFTKFYQAKYENDPLVAVSLVKNFEKI